MLVVMLSSRLLFIMVLVIVGVTGATVFLVNGPFPPAITGGTISSTDNSERPNNDADQSLVIYVGRSETLVGPIIQAFAEQSGVEVKTKYGGTPELVATLLEEGDRSPADIFFSQSGPGLGAVDSMLEPLPEALLEQVPEWARPSVGKWIGISGRARTIVYNTEKVTEAELPDEIWGFVDPKWKGRIGWAPANTSFQTMVTAMRVLWGSSKTLEWLEGIQANEPVAYTKNTPQVVAVASGEIDVGFVNHYYLFRFLSEEGPSFPARNYHPRAGGPGAIVMVAGAGILATSKNQGDAQEFLEFMVSEQAQEYFSTQTYEYPLIAGIPSPDFLTPIDQIVRPVVPIKEMMNVESTLELLKQSGVLP